MVLGDANYARPFSQSIPETGVRAGFLVNTDEPIVVRQPEVPITIFIDGGHKIRVQTIGIARFVPEDFELWPSRIKMVGASRMQSSPDVALAIPEQTNDPVLP